ncbi:amidohydrolase family protein [Pseudokineococcus basanitobsidens]|uniref:Amidohydrolase family protein n=1 Tax=Pseudokineococcus basanitobsidens TaxID=1926649 RepID=A0ABU8RKP3_9ACTN
MAHARGRRVVAHATTTGTVVAAQQAGVDVVTHAPLDAPLEPDDASRMALEGRLAVPTLTMMEATARNLGLDYGHARASVTAMHAAGVVVLAGTDANAAPGVPASVPHGESLSHELELLVEAGLSPLEALRAATVLPAQHLGLGDRGAVEPGLRADLVLLDGDPLVDITATRRLLRVWCGGVEREVAADAKA